MRGTPDRFFPLAHSPRVTKSSEFYLGMSSKFTLPLLRFLCRVPLRLGGRGYAGRCRTPAPGPGGTNERRAACSPGASGPLPQRGSGNRPETQHGFQGQQQCTTKRFAGLPQTGGQWRESRLQGLLTRMLESHTPGSQRLGPRGPVGLRQLAPPRCLTVP